MPSAVILSAAKNLLSRVILSAAKNLQFLALVAALTSCVEQPVIPRVGIPTLDDPQAGSYMAVSAGQEHSCAITTAGTAHCWGSNEYGQLGAPSDSTCRRDDRDVLCRLRPRAVTGSHQFQQIAAGSRHTCALTTAGRAWCWGDNVRGALGDPTVRSTETPIPVLTSATFTSIVVGRHHTCGLRTDGFVLCWGANENGQLGLNSIGLGVATPDSVRSPTRFASIAAGGTRTCGRTTGGNLLCWGSTWVTTLNGSDVTHSQSTPLLVSAPPFKAIAVGSFTTCAIAIQGAASIENTAYCWEGNSAGAIGDGTAAGSADPRLVLGGLRLVAISVGELHACGIADDGQAFCWGAGSSGQLGVSTAFLSSRCGASGILCSTLPLRVSGWRTYTQISAGQGNHVCGLTLGGNVYCWGAAALGQRGDGRAFFGDWAPVKTADPAP